MSKYNHIVPKKLNYFEKAGLIAILKKELNYDIERQYCGSNTKGMLLVQNHLVALHPDNYPYLSSVGINSENNEVLLEFDNDEEDSQLYSITTQHLLKKVNPIKYLKQIKV